MFTRILRTNRIQKNSRDPNYFKVTQGETCINCVAMYIGDIDISLIKIKDGIAFNNCFLKLTS